MKNFVHQGLTLTVTAPYGVNSGGGTKVGNLFGVAVNNQNNGDNMEILVMGVFDLTKDTSTFNSGDAVYWSDTSSSNVSTGKATSSASGNLVIGTAELTQASGVAALGGAAGDATVRVRLNGFLPGATGISTGLRVAHSLYVGATDGYTQAGSPITPAISDSIPANAVIYGGVVNSEVAVTSGGAATVAIGTAAGSSASSILTATGKASFTLDAVLKPTCATTPFKMTAAGQITFTVGTADLTAGTIEVWVFYHLATIA